MVAHAQHDAFIVTYRSDFNGLSRWIKAQGVTQQVVQRPFDQRRPTLQAQPTFVLQLDSLFRCIELSILVYGLQNRIKVHRLSPGLVGIDAGQYQNLADQRFEAVAFAGQARP
ncbi:hypothetical protein D3C72_1331200 [compost metagenome]